ncbi:methyltransferase domain-containing protein [Flammeovirga yaeyamensis]|uniref:Methyltransferase domain-containing protein n=1 Tax=Flammeovirga yaeyamensis TaxID=367791 RepID=A0AAX1NAC2_9BACT|nr:class I SAM-dependent methyltransferase [Flammeovirga yaeyamensis]MBB3699187.1 ubiquinone/menaquinone biosynthesis C-methylase UbiE [Flammeovirga yaeyamensis]NMF35549.1 class I SAM-dependent methyltransferase [Flammeovirga yaeyamensis]QWG04407.1 methyltransferase domain-containing protein [Flammeovirga yaeyamensis]
MSIEKAYNIWSKQYDTNNNKTRDLDKIVTQKKLSKYSFETVLELGCGTGKNTEWLIKNATEITAFDFSEEMLAVAKEKVKDQKVTFNKVDLNQEWPVADNYADLITTNLVLEHIKDLDHIFKLASEKIKKDGLFFICELHPFKQYSGTKARYETEKGTEELEVYTHHISEFIFYTKKHHFQLIELDEWFDDDDKTVLPRLVSFVLQYTKV